MRIVLATLVVALAMFSTACSEGKFASPASPTAVVTAPAPAPANSPAASQAVTVMGMPLSWQLADSCGGDWVQKPALPLEVVFGKEPEIHNLTPSGELQLRWLDASKSSTKPVVTCMSPFEWEEKNTKHYVLALFKEQGGEWRYCRWDSLTWEQFVHKVSKFPEAPCQFGVSE